LEHAVLFLLQLCGNARIGVRLYMFLVEEKEETFNQMNLEYNIRENTIFFFTMRVSIQE
jgi:hypothetical protein